MMLSERKTIVLLLLLALIFLVYSNTFDASWHMDDFPNITHFFRQPGADQI
jgi:hypothetical protein